MISRRRREPGRLLLRLAGRLSDPSARAALREAVADLQYESREADARGRDRFAARCRGHYAYWRLLMTVSFASSARPVEDRILTFLFGASRNRPMPLIVAVTTLALWPMLAWFGAAAVLAGLVTAVVIRLWNDRHPTLVSAPETSHRVVEINLAATPVDGNVGGFFFAAGTVVIVLVGLPGLTPLLLASLLGGVGLGAALFAWRQVHPTALAFPNSLRLR